MKKIIIPTDFSDNAWDALIYAIRLFDDISCTFYVLNTYQVSSSRVLNTIHKERDTLMYHFLKEESEKELKKISTHLNDTLLNDKHKYKILSKFGSLIPILKNIVSTENIDLIIMGTTGASGIKEIFMGSNAVKVIKHIDLCPVLSVPKSYEYQELELVVFATDFKRQYNTIELTCLSELQLIHNFMVNVIHIKKENTLSTIQQLNIEILKQFFETDMIKFEDIDTNTTVEKAIHKYVSKHNAGMVCLLNYEHSIFEKFTTEPIINRVSFHSEIPLLIIPV